MQGEFGRACPAVWGRARVGSTLRARPPAQNAAGQRRAAEHCGPYGSGLLVGADVPGEAPRHRAANLGAAARRIR